VIEIMAIAREPGYRTKVAVASADIKVDCVGACVGVRGSRIKNIVAELNDEKIDIVRWSDSRDSFIGNALKPAEVREVVVVSEFNRARVIVPEEELSLAIGKRGRNVRLAAKLCNCDIDVLSEAEAERELQEMMAALDGMANVPDRFAQRLFQMGYSIEDIADGAKGWCERFDVGDAVAAEVYERAKAAVVQIAAARVEAEAAAVAAEAQEAAAAAAAAEAHEAEAADEEEPAGDEAQAAEPDGPADELETEAPEPEAAAAAAEAQEAEATAEEEPEGDEAQAAEPEGAAEPAEPEPQDEPAPTGSAESIQEEPEEQGEPAPQAEPADEAAQPVDEGAVEASPAQGNTSEEPKSEP